MIERNNYKFYDCSNLVDTEGIFERATEEFIRTELEERFPNEKFVDIKVEYNGTGKFKAKANLIEKAFGGGKPVEGLPEYISVEMLHSTGEYMEELIVWSPIKWNDRFAGTAGGGTGIGGKGYLTAPDNTTRGWTVPYAVMNGFTAATIWAGNSRGTKDYILDKKTGAFSEELYENWRVRSTHNMTVFGKAIAEILHNRPVKYSYMNGGSGGGRQSLMEMQNYPEDYDGIWAACPAINWHAFLTSGLWPIAVMNEYNHFLSPKKNEFFIEQVHKKYGGADSFYKMENIPEFDASVCVGMESKDGVISEKDALVMNEIWNGPHTKDGRRLWYGYYPGCKNWLKGIPIGAYYYPVFGKQKVKPFILGTYHARWITGNPNDEFKEIDIAGFEELFVKGMDKFSNTMGNNPKIEEFVNHGGKVIIDHGMDDPLIPTDGSIDYYQKLCEHFGGEDKVSRFCRLYITPGDNHGNCWGNGPGITESTGMSALINWVENGIAPEKMPKIKVDKKSGKTIETGEQAPYSIT